MKNGRKKCEKIFVFHKKVSGLTQIGNLPEWKRNAVLKNKTLYLINYQVTVDDVEKHDCTKFQIFLFILSLFIYQSQKRKTRVNLNIKISIHTDF